MPDATMPRHPIPATTAAIRRAERVPPPVFSARPGRPTTEEDPRAAAVAAGVPKAPGAQPVVSGVFGLACIGFFSGCVASVHLPPGDDLESPAVFYLSDQGRHNTLLLPTGTPGVYAQYGYGDWDYYALSRTGFFSSAAALLFPTQGALGRGVLEVSGPESGRAPEPLPAGAVRMDRLYAETDAIETLRRTLDQLFEEQAGSVRQNDEHALAFVPHPDDYWIFHNSHTVIGDWLESMGLDVRGQVGIVTDWKVVDPAER